MTLLFYVNDFTEMENRLFNFFRLVEVLPFLTINSMFQKRPKQPPSYADDVQYEIFQYLTLVANKLVFITRISQESVMIVY